MAGIVDSISLAIETFVLDHFDGADPEMHFKSWGFVELASRSSRSPKTGGTSNQPIPMTINGTGQREQVSINDRYDYIHWIRWVSPITSVESEADSWGVVEGKRMTLPLRIVVAHKVEIGENFILELVNAIPENIIVPGLDFVFLKSDYSIDPDHEEIYRTELGDTVYEQHRFNWNIYVINISAEFAICIPSSLAESSPDEEFKIYDLTYDSIFD